MVHFGSCIPDDTDIFGEKAVSVLVAVSTTWLRELRVEVTLPSHRALETNTSDKLPSDRMHARNCITYGLLLSKITRSAEDNNDGIVFQLHCPENHFKP